MKISIQELVIFGLLAGAAGGIVADCRPAHAGVVDDAAAVRRAVEHIDKVMTEEFRRAHPATPQP